MVSDSRVGPMLNRLGGIYRDPNRVDRDASSLLKSGVGKHLSPNIASLVENNGNTANTLCLKGTISIYFRAQEYQQLMDIHLPPGYPVRPPVAYVRLAAPNMYLKENHPHVGSDGQVYLPYLHEWRPNSHTLIELVVAMSSVFSADPPVFTRAAAAPVPPPPPPTSSYASSYASHYTSASIATTGHDSMASTGTVSEREAIMQVQEQIALEESKREAELAEKERLAEQQRAAQEAWDAKNFASTKDKVRRKMHGHLVQAQQEVQCQVQTDMMDAKRLQLSQERLEGQLESMVKAKEELEKQHVVVDKALAEIAVLVESTKEKQKAEEESKQEQENSIDDLVCPASGADAQLLKLSTENASYSDALYFLDKALHHRTITVTAHLKAVRQLAKKQFMARAHLVKITQWKQMNGNGHKAAF
jgi:ESCRT-I complex subunit TSG101